MTNPKELKPGHCHQCGMPLSRNPHPDAGVPARVLEVNVAEVCIPCLTLSRHRWAERTQKAESALKALQAAPTAGEMPTPPEPFGHILDGSPDGLRFKKVITDFDLLMHSTSPVFSSENMQTFARQYAAQQAKGNAEDAARYRKDANTHTQIMRACGELPEGWEMRICMELDAGYVELYNPDGEEVEQDHDHDHFSDRIGAAIDDALNAAMAKEVP